MASNKYHLTKGARQDLEDILDYIEYILGDKHAANKLFYEMEEALKRICAFPQSCEIAKNEFFGKKEIRKLIVKSYSVFYTLSENDDTIIDLGIVHNRRSIEEQEKLMR